jgi:hypothetical protein
LWEERRRLALDGLDSQADALLTANELGIENDEEDYFRAAGNMSIYNRRITDL